MINVTCDQLFTTVRPRSIAGKIVQFPLSRVVIAAAFLVPVGLVHNMIVDHVLKRFSQPAFSYLLDIETIVSFALFLLIYRLYTRFVERRKAYEIAFNGSVRETAAGVAIGGGLVLVMVGLMWALTYYRVDHTGSPDIILHALFTFGMGAFIQELFFRVILFRNLEELLGSWWALVVIALIFGLAHLGNENATLWTSAALVFEDVLLTAAFMLTRRIWLVWGIHMGWNYFQDRIFGMPNSGITTLKSWIEPVISGPEWITGGSFGIEASLLAILMSLGVGVCLLARAIHCKQVVLPIWKRRLIITSPETNC